MIAALATKKAEGRDVLVLSSAEQVNLMGARVVRGRIQAIGNSLRAIPNPGPPDCMSTGISKSAPGAPESRFRAELGAPDVGAFLATDTTYASVPLSLDDRMLIAAIGISGGAMEMSGATKERNGRADWQTATEGTSAAKPATFLIPSEVVYVPEKSVILREYLAMMALADTLRHCKTDQAKAAVALADAYSKELTTPGEKTGVSPLGSAVQASAALNRTTEADRVPYILRVTVEKAGGTAITRGNIWYTLGFPGAATVSSGLLTSYRLVDPSTGITHSAGFVRCVIPPVRMGNVHLVVNKEAQNYFNKDSKRGETYCSYIATP